MRTRWCPRAMSGRRARKRPGRRGRMPPHRSEPRARCASGVRSGMPSFVPSYVQTCGKFSIGSSGSNDFQRARLDCKLCGRLANVFAIGIDRHWGFGFHASPHRTKIPDLAQPQDRGQNKPREHTQESECVERFRRHPPPCSTNVTANQQTTGMMMTTLPRIGAA